MISLTGEYALRALVFLAERCDEWPITASRIAGESGIPRKYLSRVLADLVRAGVLSSTPGRRGGFKMCKLPEQVSLFEVLSPFESVLTAKRACVFGHETCDDEQGCTGHIRWKGVREAFQRFVEDTTVKDVTRSPVVASVNGPLSGWSLSVAGQE